MDNEENEAGVPECCSCGEPKFRCYGMLECPVTLRAGILTPDTSDVRVVLTLQCDLCGKPLMMNDSRVKLPCPFVLVRRIVDGICTNCNLTGGFSTDGNMHVSCSEAEIIKGPYNVT